MKETILTNCYPVYFQLYGKEKKTYKNYLVGKRPVGTRG